MSASIDTSVPMMPVAAVKLLKGMDADKYGSLTSQTVYSWIKQKLIPIEGRNQVTVDDLQKAFEKAIERKAEREQAKVAKAEKDKADAAKAKADAEAAVAAKAAEPPKETEPLKIAKEEPSLQEQLNASVKAKAQLEGVKNAGKHPQLQHAGKK